MANQEGEPFVLDFPNGQRVEDILKKAQSDYSKAEIDAKMSSKANTEDVYSKSAVDTALDNKVDKETGKGLSTNDYTTAEKNKLAGIEAQANKTVVDDTLDDSSTNPVQNKVVKAALDNKADTADIPTVPITAIQKNGTGITPVSGTVNITVPTTAADVSALPASTKYAAALSLTINSSTFVMTGQLKDQSGDNLGTAQTIDLPLENVVVGGSYNSQTKKVVLTLQNGNTIEFSVADLVSGLQTELSASNKLNPAYINYDSTHRAVSDTEKSTWNGKQNALSSTQLAAVNSGINSTKVEQIETNKNNISSLTPTILSKKYITIAADTWEDTGYAITIPAGKTAIFSASAEYSNRAPLGIALATGDPTTSTRIFAIQECNTTNLLGQLTFAGVIDCRQRSVGRTVKLYVKYADTHTNGNVVCLTYTLI